ncbi:maltose ABC transporter permease MalF [Paludibacterium purpuratum]|uniref:Maltose/maltodextrin transport system permease protein n=1 Tax=Paludibacterium purpuratum TaxID=1144873 RepID=A0A4R7B1A0_9NEIS|nr:maltose ABC transporter permease MalF [Paludibacterium purpuratum]TDR73048.1 maltooligosaccharide ABC transporter membrane protein [Paludibacterium purpuratum]
MYAIDWRRIGKTAGVVLTLLALWLVFGIYRAGHPWLASGGLAFLAASAALFSWQRAYAWRYLYPGIVAILVFIVFPALYTMRIGFTNYSSSNLLSFERATAYLMDQTCTSGGDPLKLQLLHRGQRFELVLQNEEGGAWHSAAIALAADKPQTLSLTAGGDPAAGEQVPLRDLIALQPALRSLTLNVPGLATPYRLNSLTSFAPAAPLYRRNTDGSLKNLQTGDVLRPNFQTGFYQTAAGANVQPGFRVDVGWKNFVRLFGSAELQAPLMRVFAWTVLFAGLTVLITFCIGFALATVLSWEALRMRTTYRVLLFLPYAVPGFISILIFRGLFNENFGEINMVLHALFGIRPNWFSDPLLAKSMLLIVNSWLGYPYMMLLCLGLIKSIPSDLYEASAIAGATAWQNLTRITLPLILKPIMPLLIASFAFNFNNFVLISLLTDGRPDFTDSLVPAGTTDILVSYTYRIAFQDSGQNFGLAAAISTLIFLLVALLSVVNLKLMRVNAQDKR